jgi:uncharacterized protein involved in outer membrane biogenesis
MFRLRTWALLAVALIACGLLIEMIPLGALRGPIETRLSESLGRPVTIDGDLHIDFGFDLEPELAAEEITLASPGTETGAPRGHVSRLFLNLKLLRLFSGVIDIDELEIEGGELVLEAGASGRRDPRDTTTTDASGSREVELHVRHFHAENLRLVARNVTSGLETTVLIAWLDAQAPSTDQPIIVSARGEAKGVEFTVSGELGAMNEFWSPTQPYPIALTGSLGGLELGAEGSIERPAALDGLDITVSLDAPDLASISEEAGERFPELGPVAASARLIDRDGSTGIEDIEIAIGEPGDPLEIVVRGDFDDVPELDEIELDVQLRARDLSVLGALFDVDLPPIGPVSVSGRLHGSDERISADRVEAHIDKTRFHGSLTGSFVPGTRPRVTARIQSPLVYLDDVGIEPRDDASQDDGGFSLFGSDGWSADSILPYASLPEIDADVSLEVDRLSGHAGLMIEGLSAKLRLAEGVAAIEEFEIVAEYGQVVGDARIETGSDTPALFFRSTATGIRLEMLAAQFEEDPSLTGNLDALIDLESRGDTLALLRSNLRGEVTLVIRDGRAASAWARSFERNLARAFVSTDVEREFESLECLIADFQVARGRASVRTLWFETERAILSGQGAIDLGRGTFDLRIVPKPKRPGIFSIAASVKVSGPFDDPDFTANKRSLASSAARGLWKNVTRPSNPLLRRWWSQQGDENGPCANAFASDRSDG